MIPRMRWRARGDAKYVGATSPITRPSGALRKCERYQASPRSKCWSKNRVSLVGCDSDAHRLKTLCSHVVPVRGGPMMKNEGSAEALLLIVPRPSRGITQAPILAFRA